ncbi:MAG: ATP-binding protein [Candidatus Gracilibacteria bacterium]|nr:ATP-binding protein [Candidatus Gracilibacteria bacterium]
MIYRRKKYLDKIYKSLENEKLVLLLGTRQVGKTTILEILKDELKGKIFFYSFEDDFSKQEFNSKDDFINYFRILLGVNFYEDGYFLIDEFQYIKNGEQILKSLYDDKNIKLKFIVTGSGLWTYNEENKGTLVGRGTEIFVYSFDFFEFLDYKGLNVVDISIEQLSNSIISLVQPYFDEFITFGGYPAVLNAVTKDEKIRELEKIINRYIERDISFFLSKDELINFKKFFLYLNTQIGNLIKKESISEYLGIKLKYIEKYLLVMEKTMFISRVYPYFKDKSKEYSSLPKFYFSDVGILNFLEKGFDFRENNGKVVENFVYTELLKNKHFNSDEIKVYKKITKSEIDFIYDGMDLLIPIEVKSGNKKSIPKIFESFENDYGKLTSYYIMTSSNIAFEENISEKKLLIIPNWYIGKII